MRDPKTFRKYAAECRRLAGIMADHKDTLLLMAETWISCAEAAERNAANGRRNGADKAQPVDP
jgi:hypothetical protein